MRPLAALLAMASFVAGCAQPGPAVIRDAAACLAPAAEPTQSLATLVDRADVVMLATVVRTEPIAPAGTGPRDLVFGAVADRGERVTLRTIRTAKGAVPPELVVEDGPCPMLLAGSRESLVVLLDQLGAGAFRPIGFPTSAVRAMPGRSLDQLMTEIAAIRPLDGDARALLERHGWTVTAKEHFDEFALPAPSAFGLAGREIRTQGARLIEPLDRYAALSGDVGLDLKTHAGQRAELMTFDLDRKRDDVNTPGAPRGHILVVDRRVVGAWVSLWPEGPAFSVRDRAGALAASSLTARRSPPPNRAPQGINVARAYDLASARSIAFKTGRGGGGELSDPARIRAFADALDEVVATAQLVGPSESRPSGYYFHIAYESGYLSLEYDTEGGKLSVFLDGFTAEAPARFAALVAALPMTVAPAR